MLRPDLLDQPYRKFPQPSGRARNYCGKASVNQAKAERWLWCSSPEPRDASCRRR